MMRKRRIRLSLGSVLPEDRSIFARRYFFAAVERHVPLMLDQLVTVARTPGIARSDSGCFDPDTESALRAWTLRWGIPYADPWWMSDIRLHLQHWHAFPDEAGRWSGVIGHYRAVDWPTLRPWRATEEPEAEFRARVEAYIADVKAMPGLHPTPETYSASDFDAFVLEHVAQRPIEQILERLGDENRDASSTRKRNRQVAALLGLRLRRRRRGHPTTQTGRRPVR